MVLLWLSLILSTNIYFISYISFLFVSMMMDQEPVCLVTKWLVTECLVMLSASVPSATECQVILIASVTECLVWPSAYKKQFNGYFEKKKKSNASPMSSGACLNKWVSICFTLFRLPFNGFLIEISVYFFVSRLCSLIRIMVDIYMSYQKVLIRPLGNSKL